MDFALAQLLEAAGWPQGGRGKWIVDPNSLIGRKRVYQPTLEELFESCGHHLAALRQEENGRWAATGPNGEARGLSPTEAVARYWLKLKKARG